MQLDRRLTLPFGYHIGAVGGLLESKSRDMGFGYTKFATKENLQGCVSARLPVIPSFCYLSTKSGV